MSMKVHTAGLLTVTAGAVVAAGIFVLGATSSIILVALAAQIVCVAAVIFTGVAIFHLINLGLNNKFDQQASVFFNALASTPSMVGTAIKKLYLNCRIATSSGTEQIKFQGQLLVLEGKEIVNDVFSLINK